MSDVARPPARTDDGRTHLVVVGGGFGGLELVKRLAGAGLRITLVDRRNHHLFQPLLYQVASAALAPADIAEPIRSVLAGRDDVLVMLAEAQRVDTAARVLHTSEGPLAYDLLVLAAGATHSYFGNDSWAAHAPGLKSLDDALQIRQRVLLAFERAEWSEDPDERRRLLTFVVVGGGPTGVELAGALCEISRHTLRQDFHRIDPASARVVLVEARDAVLGSYEGRLPARALAQLEDIGVEVRLGAQVTAVDPLGVVLASDHPDGERLEARTVLWGAGVAGAPVAETVGAKLDRAGRVQVQPDLTIAGFPEVRVIGDLAAFTHDPRFPSGLPGVAQVALQMGKHAARDIRAGLKGGPTRPFRYKDLGSMATIGRSRAVADLGFVQLSGVLAWLAWLFVHLMALVGFRNRLVVFTQWAWNYLTWERGSRLIRGEPRPPSLDDRGEQALDEALPDTGLTPPGPRAPREVLP